MKMIIKSIIVVYLILQFKASALCESIVIIESQSFDEAHNMDDQWKSIFLEKGMTVEIFPQTTLDLISNLNDVEFLIISNGLIEITPDRLHVIQQFIQQGGHVYLQSEYQIQSFGNQAFSQLIENLGGSFTWEGEMSGNLTPVDITNGFSYEGDFLPFFWYGAFGSGDNNIVPFLEKNNRAFGFYYCSTNIEYGKLITVSDQDWIRFNMKPELMHQIIDFCLQQNSFQLPQIEIKTSTENPCEGESVTYGFEMESSAATIVSCQWYIDDIEVSDAMDSTFTSSLVVGEKISCKISLQKDCALFDITSMVSLLPYQDKIIADVQITIDSSNGFCLGSPITFTANPEFNIPTVNYYFQWYVNQNLVEGMNEANFISSDLNENDEVTCKLIYDTPCSSGLSISSNELAVDLWEMTSFPTLSIQATNEISCEGESISFLASDFDLGTFTNFIWKVDGEEVYQGSSTFTLNNPSNGQVITCEAVMDTPCATNQLISSAPIVMDLTPIVIPDFNIEASSEKVCKGESIQFQITTSASQTEFQYQWQVNGINVGTNDSILELENIEDPQSVQCIVTINNDCPSPIEIITEQIQIEIIEPFEIEIGIFSNKNIICKGELVTIDVIGQNLPENIAYQWFLDNQLLSTCTTPYFNSDSIMNQQNIRCEILVPEQECAASYTIASNTIQISVSQIGLDIIELQPEICGNDGKVEIEAYDGIDEYSYQWNDGFSDAIRSDLSAGDYSLTISDAMGCEIEEHITIDKSGDSLYATIQIRDYDATINYGFLNVETNAVSPVFSWNTPLGLSCVDCPQPLVEGGHILSYEVTVTDNRGCSISSSFEMPTENKTPTKNIYIPNAFTPNDDGYNDYFTAYGYNDDSIIKNIKIFDNKGHLIFDRDDLVLSDEENGWHGRDLNNNIVPTGVYLYVVAIQFKDELKTFKGDITKL